VFLVCGVLLLGLGLLAWLVGVEAATALVAGGVLIALGLAFLAAVSFRPKPG
jgi:hypothetical protein